MTLFETWYERIIAIHETSPDLASGAQNLLQLANDIDSSDLTTFENASLKLVCSSLLINAGADLRKPLLMDKGQELATWVREITSASHPMYYQATFNVANAMLDKCELAFPHKAVNENQFARVAESHRINRAELREVRSLFSIVGSSELADSHTRSSAYCNLANCLDFSGRWAEAYDFYLLAIHIDPLNGNAAGNLAQLLMNRVRSGVGQTGHIAAVYDKYVKLAHSLREGTIKYAGEKTAVQWDELEETKSQGHLLHGLGEQDDEYRAWVANHRLALSGAVEGLGTEDAHWDTATIETLYGRLPEYETPQIIAEMNVLKSEFLVSRRLAFDGYTQVIQGPEQKDDDSGYYVDTNDYSLYGTQYSKLVLAQRSALDVLDKTAVIANEYFEVGDDPGKLYFRNFWARKDGTVRAEFQRTADKSMAAFALSELAFDLEDAGMYAQSQRLRNAGTHRIVHAAVTGETGVTNEARSRINFMELVESTILSLQVTRSAYLYLIDLVASCNRPEDHGGDKLLLISHEYMRPSAGN